MQNQSKSNKTKAYFGEIASILVVRFGS